MEKPELKNYNRYAPANLEMLHHDWQEYLAEKEKEVERLRGALETIMKEHKFHHHPLCHRGHDGKPYGVGSKCMCGKDKAEQALSKHTGGLNETKTKRFQ